MDAVTKKEIDDIWLNSYKGAWCKAVAKNDVEAAGKALQDEYNADYFSTEMLSRELADKMTEYLKNFVLRGKDSLSFPRPSWRSAPV